MKRRKINEICFTYKTSLPSTQKQPKLLNLHSFPSLMKNCNSFFVWLTQVTDRQIETYSELAMNISEYSHIIPALQDLHWLPVHARIHFKILILVFKGIYGLATPYIRDLISVQDRSPLTILNQIVVFYLSRLKRKCFLRLVPDPSMPLCHVRLWNS